MRDTPPAIGFITPPAWFDPAPAEFSKVCAAPVRTQQAPLPLPDLDYRLESVARTEPELTLCARLLGAAGCDLIAQAGTPFAWAGVSSEDAARARCARIAEAAGVPLLMTGLAIVDALHALEVKRAALACTYYDSAWKEGWRRFVELCGFDVVHADTMTEQGLVAPGAGLDHGWTMTPQLSRETIRRTASAATDAGAIVVTGTGTRTLTLMAELENETGRPIVGADTVLYWAILKHLGLAPAKPFGRLFAQL